MHMHHLQGQLISQRNANEERICVGLYIVRILSLVHIWRSDLLLLFGILYYNFIDYMIYCDLP